MGPVPTDFVFSDHGHKVVHLLTLFKKGIKDMGDILGILIVSWIIWFFFEKIRNKNQEYYYSRLKEGEEEKGNKGTSGVSDTSKPA